MTNNKLFAMMAKGIKVEELVKSGANFGKVLGTRHNKEKDLDQVVVDIGKQNVYVNIFDLDKFVAELSALNNKEYPNFQSTVGEPAVVYATPNGRGYFYSFSCDIPVGYHQVPFTGIYFKDDYMTIKLQYGADTFVDTRTQTEENEDTMFKFLMDFAIALGFEIGDDLSADLMNAKAGQTINIQRLKLPEYKSTFTNYGVTAPVVPEIAPTPLPTALAEVSVDEVY